MTTSIPMSYCPLFAGHRDLWRSDPLAFLAGERDRHGPTFRFRLGPQTIVVVSDAPSVDAVLRRSAAAFVKPPLLAHFGAMFFGQSLTALDGDAWRGSRGAIQKSLASRDRGGPRVDRVDPLTAGGDAVAELAQLFTRVLAVWLLRTEPNNVSEHSASIVRSLGALDAHIAGGIPWPSWLPLARTATMRRERALQERIARGWIASSAADAPLRQALGDGDPRILLDNANIAIGLGAHQTALAAAWTLLELARHPAEQARAATSSDIAEHATLEALRLHPPFYAIVRQAAEDVVLPGAEVGRGKTLMISPYLMHRDPALFDRPNDFVPSRWASRPAASLPQGAFLPFGAGPRACIARHVLVPLVAGVVSRLLRRYAFDPPAAGPRPRAGVVLGFDAKLEFPYRPRVLEGPDRAPAWGAGWSTLVESHAAAS